MQVFKTRAAVALASLCAALCASAPAHAAITLDPAAGEVASHVVGDESLVAGGSYVTKPPTGGSVGLGSTSLGGMPTNRDQFAILSTGDASLAETPNVSGSSGADLGGGSQRGNTDFDVTVVKIDVNLPSYVNCMTGMDFRFLSDEYSEWVGSSYNDAFIMEIDQSTWSTSGSSIIAPDNVAFDPEGNPISINAAGVTSMTAEAASGTTYDGATPLLSAAAPITPGQHSIYLSIFDQGDNVYDSAVFVDNLRFGRVADVQRDCKPGAELSQGGKMVGLGDSYSSGFGMGDYFPGTNKDGTDNDCQRSRKAFAPLIAEEIGLDLDFHACQGGVTKDFYFPREGGAWGEAPQLDYLGPDTGLATFSIGGNDAGFADILAECVLGFELLPFNTCYGDDKVTEPIAAAFARLDGGAGDPDIYPYETVFRDARERTPYAERVAVAYPSLFPAEGGDRTFLPGGRCELVKKADQRWMVEKTIEMNVIMRRNALLNGFHFANANHRFAGHELCGEDDDEWFYGLTSGGRMHPTAPGHQAMADEIMQLLENDVRPRFLVKPYDTETHDFVVDALDEILSLFSDWPGSDVEMTVISPSGKRYTRANPGEGVYHDNGPTWENFQIPNPEPGNWKVELYGADVAPEGEETRLLVHTEKAPNQRPNGKIAFRAEGDELVFDAGGSSDPDGTIEGYDWYIATADDDQVKQGETFRMPKPTEPQSVTLVVTDDDGMTDFVTVSVGAALIGTLDVKPGSPQNTLNLKSRGVLPVAIPSSADFDATTIDPASLRLGPNGAKPRAQHVHKVDVNGDGRLDLKVQFPVQDIGATADTTSLRLTGKLPDGRDFAAEDTVRIVGR
jgi:hypothetical protein